jgi:hypothetical protein
VSGGRHNRRMLTGLGEIIRKETYLPVTLVANLPQCVAIGFGKLLDDIRFSGALGDLVATGRPFSQWNRIPRQ